ncbi:hypothetical protein CUMW_231970 [Citrus unshiu]|nr:hypothetical protein CUMW_231970 [Citrus unshiu]
MYLEEKYPQPPLLPSDLKRKAINYQVNFKFAFLSSFSYHLSFGLFRFASVNKDYQTLVIASVAHGSDMTKSMEFNAKFRCKYVNFADLETNAFPFVPNLQAANIVSSSIQPLQNLAVVKYIEEKAGADERDIWAKTHIGKGFAALEKLLKDYAGKYATGDEVFLVSFHCFIYVRSKPFYNTQSSFQKQGVETPIGGIEADLYLAPQLYAAVNRFNLDMTQFPLLLRLHEAYSKLPAFQNAVPEKQPDAPSS